MNHNEIVGFIWGVADLRRLDCGTSSGCSPTRRYAAGLRNFLDLYRPLAASWQVFDNSGRDPILVAAGERDEVLTVEQPEAWARFRGDAPEMWREVPMKEERSRITRIMLETRDVDEAIRLAVRDALLEHKREGLPVVIWRDGRPLWVSVGELEIEEDRSVPPKHAAP